jgi:hypothetical protein
MGCARRAWRSLPSWPAVLATALVVRKPSVRMSTGATVEAFFRDMAVLPSVLEKRRTDGSNSEQASLGE